MDNLSKACMLAALEWSETIEQEINLFDEDFLPSAKELIALSKKRKRYRNKKALKFILVAAIILLSAITVVAVSPLGDFIVEKYKEYSDFYLNGATEYTDMTEINLTYIPERYNIIQNDKSKSVNMILMEDGSNWISIHKSITSSTLRLDTENYSYTEFCENGQMYYIFHYTSEATGVMWQKDNFVYTISGSEEFDELLLIAKGTT